jgi:ribosome-associated translation inhibitor RaiA
MAKQPVQITEAASIDIALLAVDAEERAAQLAVAIETISDELERLLVEVRDLRGALMEERIVLDQLAASA